MLLLKWLYTLSPDWLFFQPINTLGSVLTRLPGSPPPAARNLRGGTTRYPRPAAQKPEGYEPSRSQCQSRRRDAPCLVSWLEENCDRGQVIVAFIGEHGVLRGTVASAAAPNRRERPPSAGARHCAPCTQTGRRCRIAASKPKRVASGRCAQSLAKPGSEGFPTTSGNGHGPLPSRAHYLLSHTFLRGEEYGQDSFPRSASGSAPPQTSPAMAAAAPSRA